MNFRPFCVEISHIGKQFSNIDRQYYSCIVPISNVFFSLSLSLFSNFGNFQPFIWFVKIEHFLKIHRVLFCSLFYSKLFCCMNYPFYSISMVCVCVHISTLCFYTFHCLACAESYSISWIVFNNTDSS